jgi:hypothetical protein
MIAQLQGEIPMTTLWWIIAGSATWLLLNAAAGMLLAYKDRLARGLLRLWFVLSLCWVGYVGVMTGAIIPSALFDWDRKTITAESMIEAEAGHPASWKIIDKTTMFRFVNPSKTDLLRAGIAWAIYPPMIVLAAGIMIGWIIRGFGARHTPGKEYPCPTTRQSKPKPFVTWSRT